MSQPIKGRIAENRYYSPDGEFSIAIEPQWGPTQETIFPNQIFVDLMFNRDQVTLGIFGVSTVEWLKIARPLSTEEFRTAAPKLVAEHIKNRFASNSVFTLKETKATKTATDAPLRFLATGTTSGRAAFWQGQIVPFGDRIAFVSHVTIKDERLTKEPSSVDDFSDALVNWMGSIRREK